MILHALIWTLLIALIGEGVPWRFPQRGDFWMKSVDRKEFTQSFSLMKR